jgi:hypothetical protein
MIDWQKVAAHYALRSLFEAPPDGERIYCYRVDIKDTVTEHNGHTRLTVGNAQITSEITLESEILSFGAIYMGEHTMNAGVGVYQTENNYSALKQELSDAFGRADFPDVIRILDRHFGDLTYSLRSIFHDDQRHILNRIMKSTVATTEGVYGQVYETHAPMMRFLGDLRVPLPRAFLTAAEFALNSSLRNMFEDSENLDFAKINPLLEESGRLNIGLDATTLGFALRKTIKRMSERLVENPGDLQLMVKIEMAAGLARRLPFEVNIWKAQNNYYSMLHNIAPQFVDRHHAGDTEAQEWMSHFTGLGRNLSVSLRRLDRAQVRKAAG